MFPLKGLGLVDTLWRVILADPLEVYRFFSPLKSILLKNTLEGLPTKCSREFTICFPLEGLAFTSTL